MSGVRISAAHNEGMTKTNTPQTAMPQHAMSARDIKMGQAFYLFPDYWGDISGKVAKVVGHSKTPTGKTSTARVQVEFPNGSLTNVRLADMCNAHTGPSNPEHLRYKELSDKFAQEQSSSLIKADFDNIKKSALVRIVGTSRDENTVYFVDKIDPMKECASILAVGGGGRGYNGVSMHLLAPVSFFEASKYLELGN